MKISNNNSGIKVFESDGTENLSKEKFNKREKITLPNGDYSVVDSSYNDALDDRLIMIESDENNGQLFILEKHLTEDINTHYFKFK